MFIFPKKMVIILIQNNMMQIEPRHRDKGRNVIKIVVMK